MEISYLEWDETTTAGTSLCMYTLCYTQRLVLLGSGQNNLPKTFSLELEISYLEWDETTVSTSLCMYTLWYTQRLAFLGTGRDNNDHYKVGIVEDANKAC